MNKSFFFLTALLMLTGVCYSQNDYNKYFHNKSLRLDYYRCGNEKSEQIFIDKYAEDPFWAGSHKNLIDTTMRGDHFVKVYDLSSNKLIFSQGHNSLFREWQSTPEAKKIPKAFPEAFSMPFPKNDVLIEFYSRTKKGEMKKVFETEADVNSYFISKERKPFESFEIFNNGHYSTKVDIVILPEGYSKNEKEKFEKECREFSEAIFSFSPYKENRSRFNVRAVWAPSEQSGPDIPGEGVWNNTQFDVMFYTFDSERYQMTSDFRKIKEVAATVPYDYIYILSNTTKYGGGGIYNFYGIGASANPALAGKVHVHEFGHQFAGLADEYNGDTTTEEFYDLQTEPWEPNITTLVDFDKKWKSMISERVPVPTPVNKKYESTLGLFEGGGYSATGIFRPVQKCLMREFNGVEDFCPVCSKAIIEQIDWITGK